MLIKIMYFDSFGVGHIPKEMKEFIGSRNTISNLYRIQAYNLIIWGYYCIGFIIDFMLKGQILLVYKNLFFSNEYEENNKIILKCLKKS